MNGLVSGFPLEAGRAEAALWQAYRADPGSAARERLFDAYAPFARAIARRHFRNGAGDVEFGDLMQLACTGLLEAIDGFDPERGVPFKGYAARSISGTILDGIARMSEVRGQISYRNRMRAERLRSLSTADAGAVPAAAAMEALIDMTVGLALGFMLEGTGLYAGDEAADSRPNGYESFAWKEITQKLEHAVAALPERERVILKHHYADGMDFEQIGALLDLSKGRISQLHRGALMLLRKRLPAPGGFGPGDFGTG